MKYRNIINALAVCGKADNCNHEKCPFYKDEESIEDRSCQRELMKISLKKLTKLHEQNKQLKAIANAYKDSTEGLLSEQDDLVYTVSQLKDQQQNNENF